MGGVGRRKGITRPEIFGVSRYIPPVLLPSPLSLGNRSHFTFWIFRDPSSVRGLDGWNPSDIYTQMHPHVLYRLVRFFVRSVVLFHTRFLIYKCTYCVGPFTTVMTLRESATHNAREENLTEEAETPPDLSKTRSECFLAIPHTPQPSRDECQPHF